VAYLCLVRSMPATAEVITETGGFRVGRNAWLALNGTWPFGTLEIHSDCLVLDTLWRRYSFPRSSILALSEFHGFFWSGLRIEHSIPAYPRFVVFWSPRMSRLWQRLADTGFPVANERPNQPLELTASRRTTLLLMTSNPSLAAARALAHSSSAPSR
jgi:hypothetical protein